MSILWVMTFLHMWQVTILLVHSLHPLCPHWGCQLRITATQTKHHHQLAADLEGDVLLPLHADDAEELLLHLLQPSLDRPDPVPLWPRVRHAARHHLVRGCGVAREDGLLCWGEGVVMG